MRWNLINGKNRFKFRATLLTSDRGKTITLKQNPEDSTERFWCSLKAVILTEEIWPYKAGGRDTLSMSSIKLRKQFNACQ